MLKYIKIFKGTLTWFDLNRSSSKFRNSGFKLLNNFKLVSNFNEVKDYSLMMIC